MLHHVINYQHVSIAFAIINGVALQEYKACNNLPHGILGTTEYYNKYLKHRIFQPTHYSYYSFSTTTMLMTKVIDTRW